MAQYSLNMGRSSLQECGSNSSLLLGNLDAASDILLPVRDMTDCHQKHYQLPDKQKLRSALGNTHVTIIYIYIYITNK